MQQCFTVQQPLKNYVYEVFITSLKKEHFSSYVRFSDTDEGFADCLNIVKIMKVERDITYSGEIKVKNRSQLRKWSELQKNYSKTWKNQNFMLVSHSWKK